MKVVERFVGDLRDLAKAFYTSSKDLVFGKGKGQGDGFETFAKSWRGSGEVFRGLLLVRF